MGWLRLRREVTRTSQEGIWENFDVVDVEILPRKILGLGLRTINAIDALDGNSGVWLQPDRSTWQSVDRFAQRNRIAIDQF
jgi:hypothetical protein